LPSPCRPPGAGPGPFTVRRETCPRREGPTIRFIRVRRGGGAGGRAGPKGGVEKKG